MYDKRGSIWRKWDLHVHTPESYHHHFGDDWDEYVKHLRDKALEHQISVMGVTDYFSVDGYEKLINEYEPKGETAIELEDGSLLYLIPNIELRLRTFDQDDHSINLHVLFDNKNLTPATIKDCFLDRLSINYRGNRLTCRDNDLVKIGYAEANDEVYNANLDLSRFGDTEKRGLKRRALSIITLSFDDINIKLNDLEESLLKTGINTSSFIFAIAAKGHGGLSNMPWFFNSTMGRQGGQRQHLLNHSQICFTNDENDRRFLLGEHNSCSKETFLKRFSSFKPCIWGSDAHELNKLFHPSNGNTDDYTWIKADPTFIGLKQIIYEPKYRVKIQSEKPVSTLRYIDKVEIKIDKDLTVRNNDQNESEPFCFKGNNTIHFSPNLNCIIGGRGAGKSTLLNMIHKKLKADENQFFDKNVTLINDEGITENIADYIEVIHNTGERIEFLNQNEIEKFALDNKKFTDAIYNRLITGEGGGELKDASSTNSEYVDLINNTIESLIEDINYDSKLNRLRKDLISKESIISFFEDDEYEKLQKEIDDISQRLSSLRRSREKLADLLSKIQQLAKQFGANLGEVTNQFDIIIQKILNGFDWVSNRYSQLSQEISDDEIDLREKLEEKRKNLSQFLKEKDIDEDSIRDLSSAQEEANELKNEIAEIVHRKSILNDKITSFSFDETSKANFETISIDNLKPVNDRLEDISQESDQVKKIELNFVYNYDEALDDLCNEMVKNYLPNHEGGRTASIPYAKEILDVILDDEMVVPDIKTIEEILENYSSSPKTAELFKDFFVNDKNYKLFRLIVERFRADVNSFKSIKVKYDDRAIESSSFGQRCTAAIVILISMGNTPIVIDEPEAHLDSALIAKYLVELIKKRKQQRQIIFATHNANFVVNGDSELIQILDMDEKNISQIQPTTIENMTYREVLVNLEGGREAFIQRENKYDFQK